MVLCVYANLVFPSKNDNDIFILNYLIYNMYGSDQLQSWVTICSVLHEISWWSARFCILPWPAHTHCCESSSPAHTQGCMRWGKGIHIGLQYESLIFSFHSSGTTRLIHLHRGLEQQLINQLGYDRNPNFWLELAPNRNSGYYEPEPNLLLKI